ncbi:helix-turn-helix domain-containing protein [Nitrobacter sp. TKz-YC01]|uniref:helix-turn-helix domain-containing protein n=1 Tax=Nitrobacter sp. TKz-YC01 TaxID=3398703 RepID=UPI003A103321
MINGPQCRAARALVEISRLMLARRSGVDVDTIERFENIAGSPKADEIEAIKKALEDLGAVFIAENGAGYGVRLKFNPIEAEQIARLECEGGIVAHDRVP